MMRKKYLLAVFVAGVFLGVILTSYHIGGTIANIPGTVQVKSSNSPWISNKYTGKMRLCSPIERLSHVRKMCNANENFHEEHSHWFIVDDEHQLLYCNIAKTGSSTMKTLLMTSTTLGLNKWIPKSSHNDEDLYARGLHYQKYSSKYKNYTKIMIVRHPFERIISAYKDKFERKDVPTFTAMKIKILRTLSKSERRLDFTFPQFVSFLQGKYNTKILKKYMDNEHWRSYEHMCSPCLIPYDYILRTEALGTEVDRYVLPLINRTSEIFNNSTRRVSQPHAYGDKTDTYGRYLEYFEQLSKSQVRFLMQRYSGVALMYGYGFDEKHLFSSCEIKTEDGDRCC